MYEKIKKVCKSCFDDSVSFRIFVCAFLISLIASIGYYTYKGGWNYTLHYPEESYTQLENEANRIFNSLKENENFETEYRYDINSYSSSTQNFDLSLYGNDNTSIKVFISSVGSSDSELSTKRGSKNFVSHFLKNLLVIIVAIPIMFGLLALLIIWPTSLILWLISFVIHKIVSCFLKK